MKNPRTTQPAPQRKRLIVLIMAVVLGLMLPEISLRFLLFGKSELARTWGAEWRQPGLYTRGQADPDFWRLKHQFTVGDDSNPPQFYDASLGWRIKLIDPVTYAHSHISELNGRRPILMYGASYAQGVTPRGTRFTSLLDQTETGSDYLLINYGVGGYGLDQMLLMYRKTIHLYKDLNPLVIFAPVVESDLERVMTDFRIWPKPHFTLESGELKLHDELSPSTPEYLEGRGWSITSFAWNYMRYGAQLLGPAPSIASLQAEQAAMVDALIRAIASETKANPHETFMLLFRTRLGLEPSDTPDPRLVGLKQSMASVDLDWIDAAPYVLNAGYSMEELYIMEGETRNHHTVLGNRVLLKAIIDGTNGKFDDDQIDT